MHVTASSRDRLLSGGRVVLTMAALPFVLLLCAFQKPQLPQTIYDGTRYSTLIDTYRRAYERVGLTEMTVVAEAMNRSPDGTVSTVDTYTFACPSARNRVTPCNTTFSVSAAVKNGICHDCRITRTSYVGDPAIDEWATAEIRRVLGKSVPPASHYKHGNWVRAPFYSDLFHQEEEGQKGDEVR